MDNLTEFREGVKKLDAVEVAALTAMMQAMANGEDSDTALAIQEALDACIPGLGGGVTTSGGGYDARGYPSSRFASGTNNAPEGVALVGEEGPELVYFSGGERVVNARQTSAVLNAMPAGGGASFTAPINISIHVDGSATEDTVQAFQSSAQEFALQVAELVRDQLADEAEDLKRRTLR